MAGNTFGHILQLTTFGESHGPAIGGILTGLPAGLVIDQKKVQKELGRRKPGQSIITTDRKEEDQVEFLSGIFNEKSTGVPIGFMIKNKDHKSADYDELKNIFRPSHADYTYQEKYGNRDHRGSGRASARETACRVVAGAIAKQYLDKQSIKIYAYVSQVGNIKVNKTYQELDLTRVDESMVRCPDETVSDQMIELIKAAKEDGDSLGGIITCVIQNVPVGLGEPVFNKLHADLGHAMLGINAVKGFEYGLGFEEVTKKGSEVNDEFYEKDGKVLTRSNYSGGIQGGISNGMDIYFRVAFKPISTIKKTQRTLSTDHDSILFEAEGRHDPCVLPRAVPIVEAMAALVIADHSLMNTTSRI
jgi:chorismate synthase